jgi:tetratricopeptide (TPR) repeat protein
VGRGFDINENLTSQVALLAAGSICAVSGGAALLAFSIFAAPMAGIAAWGLSTALKKFRTKDPTTYRAIERIRGHINQTLTGNAAFKDFASDARKAADDELSKLIARFWPTPDLIAELGANPDGFPSAIADHILDEINGSTYSSGLFEDGAAALYARAVIEGALEAALSDKAYFQSIEPQVLMKTLGLVGQLGRDVHALEGRLRTIEINFGEAFSQIEAKIDDVQVTVDEILNVVRQNQPASADEDAAARQTITEMLTSGRRASLDAVRDLMGATPNPVAATNRLKQAIAEQGDARRMATQNEIRLLNEVATINYFTNGPEAVAALQEIVALDASDVDAWNRLGLLSFRLGDLDDAFQAFQSVLDLSGDRKDIKAVAFGNMGNVAQTRGDLTGAREKWEKALSLFEDIGAAPQIQTVKGWLDGLPK